MSTAQTFENQIATIWPTERWADEVVLVAVSGGADSTALLNALARLRPREATGRLIAAHCNHGLRGAESDADEAFVRRLAEELGCEAIIERADVVAAAAARGDGLEEAARSVRYRFLEATAGRTGARYIATAHTLDDQAETLLLRILRGTGIAGLGGIPKARAAAGGGVGLVRPMLTLRRSDVLAYLSELGRTYRDDSSNADHSFTRNRVRHELLPHLAAEYNPRLVEVLANLATQAEEMQAALRPAIDALLARCRTAESSGSFELDCRVLQDAAPHVIREVLIAAWTDAGLPLQAMGFAEWKALAELATSGESAKRMFPGNTNAERRGPAPRLAIVRRIRAS
ncbi:MAG: tRNA lysidine(34) synthetase TilS [Pirellulales bacterium]